MNAQTALFSSIDKGPLSGFLPPRAEPFGRSRENDPERWQRTLTELEYRVLRDGGSEPAHSSPLAAQTAAGTYLCKGCHAPLYSSGTKFDSGIGRPTFAQALPGAVTIRRARVYVFGVRTACHCARCDGYLGVFTPDGPAPSRERHTLNGVALIFDRL